MREIKLFSSYATNRIINKLGLFFVKKEIEYESDFWKFLGRMFWLYPFSIVLVVPNNKMSTDWKLIIKKSLKNM